MAILGLIILNFELLGWTYLLEYDVGFPFNPEHFRSKLQIFNFGESARHASIKVPEMGKKDNYIDRI